MDKIGDAKPKGDRWAYLVNTNGTLSVIDFATEDEAVKAGKKYVADRQAEKAALFRGQGPQ